MIVAGIVIVDVGLRNCVGTPHQSDLSSPARLFKDYSKRFLVSFGVPVVGCPLTVHLAGKPEHHRMIEFVGLIYEVLEIVVGGHLADITRFPGYMHHSPLRLHVFRPLGRERLSVRTIHEEAGVIFTHKLVELWDIAVSLPLEVMTLGGRRQKLC